MGGLDFYGAFRVSKSRSDLNTPMAKLKKPVDLRYKYVKRVFGGRKIVATSLKEQKKIKKAFLKIYPDNLFYDELNEENSIAPEEWVARDVLECPIDLRHVYKKTILGGRKQVETSTYEQSQLKKCILMVYPDNMFYDDLKEDNSVNTQKASKKHRDASSSIGFWDLVLLDSVFAHSESEDRDDSYYEDDSGTDDDYDSSDDFYADFDSDGGFDD